MSARRLLATALCLSLLLPAIGLTGCSTEGENTLEGIPIAEGIEGMRARFAPLSLTASTDHLSAGDKEALAQLVVAADHMDKIFWLQAWAGNPELGAKVTHYTGPQAEALQGYYHINYGPWDRLSDDLAPFLGDAPHPPGAGYYPEDMTADEFEAWIEAHPDDAEAFRSLHTVIRREGDGLVAVPYSVAYQEHLEGAATAMRAAADATDDPTLATFLRSRADAFATDDYYQSDMDWMDLAGDLEVVIGPYETYEDALFGYKAAFESFLCVSLPEESAKLEKFKAELPALEMALPIPNQHKNLDRGSESPIRVVDLYYTAGDTRAGVQTIAFNLPNDERVREAKGSKKVLLKNIIDGKYEKVLTPIAQKALVPEEAGRIDPDSYFYEVLVHELVHGIGPGQIEIDGRDTEVRLELRELYSAFEEAKADVVGVHSLYVMADKGLVEPHIVEHMPWTMVAGFFRSARFGTASAHGQGVVMQINFLIEHGAVEVTPDGRFKPVLAKWREGITVLARELLMIQALGDYEGAQKFLQKYGKVSPSMQAVFDNLDDVPVDLEPIYAVGGHS